jgi:hypothetical protein
MKEVLSYRELAQQEGPVVRGMNYRFQNKPYSVLLMSVREDAPYNDGFDKDGRLIYEGEDISARRDLRHDKKSDPKKLDQPMFTNSGALTNNGIFFQAAEDFKLKRRVEPETVRVYEKLQVGVWSDKGWFDLIDSEVRYSKEEERKVFKFILQPKGAEFKTALEKEEFEFSRRIPTIVKREVWERDKGKCIECGSTNDLHFDHVIPWSKGGSSLDPKNVQLLCGKHNLQKSDKI